MGLKSVIFLIILVFSSQFCTWAEGKTTLHHPIPIELDLGRSFHFGIINGETVQLKSTLAQVHLKSPWSSDQPHYFKQENRTWSSSPVSSSEVMIESIPLDVLPLLKTLPTSFWRPNDKNKLWVCFLFLAALMFWLRRSKYGLWALSLISLLVAVWAPPISRSLCIIDAEAQQAWSIEMNHGLGSSLAEESLRIKLEHQDFDLSQKILVQRDLLKLSEPWSHDSPELQALNISAFKALGVSKPWWSEIYYIKNTP